MSKDNILDFSNAKSKKEIKEYESHLDFISDIDANVIEILGEVITVLIAAKVVVVDDLKNDDELKKLSLLHLVIKSMYCNRIHDRKTVIDVQLIKMYDALGLGMFDE